MRRPSSPRRWYTRRTFCSWINVIRPARSTSMVGRQLGPYSVHAWLGAGGMGEVYQARDTTLGREVVIKIVPDAWLASPERRARFDREAWLLASLNHPNIGAIHGVHESDGIRALVLEFVDGETLAERIARHRDASSPRRGLPVEDVVRMAGQIADAIEAAHERGIIHRDLKPSNIKVTTDGRVKVLNFGLARAVGAVGSGPDVGTGPTTTPADATLEGALMGTPAYMSPEQARGRAVDARADVWAFGCVLYEMLTGAQAFTGEGLADVFANVIKAEPDWSALPADTPASLGVCIRRCLQKDARQRVHARLRLGAGGGTARGGLRSGAA